MQFFLFIYLFIFVIFKGIETAKILRPCLFICIFYQGYRSCHSAVLCTQKICVALFRQKEQYKSNCIKNLRIHL